MSAGIISLTARQFGALITDELDGDGPCTVRPDLTLGELAATHVVPNARIMLGMIDPEGELLTAGGRLSRRFVGILIDRLHWEGSEADEIRSYYKTPDETKFLPAMYLHPLLKLARLVRHEKGRLKLTRRGGDLLADGHAGRLQADLLRTTFTRFNPAYLDGINLQEVFAPQIALILYLIGRFCDDWHPADELMRSVTTPTRELADPPRPYLPWLAFELRVLRYLRWFGLLEEQPTAIGDGMRPGRFRKTALYDRMLSFTGLP